MRISIDITCPRRRNANIPKNGKKNKRKQNYRGKDCGRRFISGHERTYRGTLSWVKNMIKIMPVGGAGIRNIGAMLQISSTTVLKVLTSTKYKIKPKRSHYDRLEIDEFWTYAGKKKDKLRLFTRVIGKTGKLRRLCGERGS